MSKSKSASVEHTGPTYNISSIFTARRDLRPTAKALVHGSGLGVEEADLLVLLYGFRKLGWDDCRVYDGGFVNFADLKSITVYDPSLFTRRINKLKEQMLVQMRLGRKVDPMLHGKAQQVRIEDAGITTIKPVWDRYVKFCNELLKDVPKPDLKAHLAVNEHICQILRDRRNPAKQLLGSAA